MQSKQDAELARMAQALKAAGYDAHADLPSNLDDALAELKRWHDADTGAKTKAGGTPPER